MIKVFPSSRFRRAYKRRIAGKSDTESVVEEKLKDFADDPFAPHLRTHKLSGPLRGLWGFRIEYDLRIVFEFNKDGNVVLLDIGTHEDVY